MNFTVDTLPLPITLRQRVEGLQPGQSLLAPETKTKVLRTTVSRVHKDHRTRRYRVGETPEGPRVWRLA